MSSQKMLADIRGKHERLYARVLNDYRALSEDEDKLEEFLGEFDQLEAEMKEAAAAADNDDDEAWLSSAATAWRLALSTYLNTPRDIKLPPARRAAEPAAERPARLMPEDEVEKWIWVKAWEVYKYRKVGELLREADRLLNEKKSQEVGQGSEQDRFIAEVEFATKVVDGEFNFARQLKSGSYKHLEQTWLGDVKKLKAYHISQTEAAGADRDDPERHYYRACDELHERLIDPSIKGTLKEFEEARAYLNAAYLTDGRVEKSNPGAEALKSAKAERLALACGDPDDRRNWRRGEAYVRMFYENIIPAVEEEDPEATLLVLKAFQTSGDFGARYALINNFEAALALYFLRPEIVREIWDASEGAAVPHAWSISDVRIGSWPERFAVPPACEGRLHAESRTGRLVFLGAMTAAQRDALLASLARPEHKAAVAELYAKSRLLPRHSTF